VQYDGWTSDLRGVPSEQRTARNATNSSIASKVIRKVLAARIVVFQRFLEIAIKIDGKLQEKHKRIWLLFQLFDQLNPGSDTTHPFVKIMNCLNKASPDALEALIRRLDDIRHTYLSSELFMVGLDEAQRALRLYRYSFISSSNDEVFRSIIREIVVVFKECTTKFVISGTGVSLAELKGTMASGVGKPVPVQLFHKLGMFDTWPKLKPFLERYVPASILRSDSGICLQIRIQEFLLGRYRFSVSFIEHLLSNGLESPHKILNKYIEAHMPCSLDQAGLPFTLEEPGIRPISKLMGFEWDRLQDDEKALNEAALLVQSHLTRKQPPSFGPVAVEMVEYGIARLRDDDHKGEIIEPLAFMSLLRWLENKELNNVLTKLRNKLAFQESRGVAYEELVVLYLLRRLRYPVPLSAIFNFHGTAPLWANVPVQIVGRLDGVIVPVDILGESPRNPRLGGVCVAANVEDVINWFVKPRTASPILLAPDLFGPDVIARVSTETMSKEIIVMGQAKSYTIGNNENLSAAVTSGALNSLDEDHWFKTMKPDRRQKLIDVIKNHEILRFVCGYPLPPNLDSTAASVTEAISALGENVILATMNLPAFKNEFITQNEYNNVLGPMEDALFLKRK